MPFISSFSSSLTPILAHPFSEHSSANFVQSGSDPSELGPLFSQRYSDKTAASTADIFQGTNNDCSLLANMAAITSDEPNFFQEHIRDNHNGTYTVNFYQDKSRWFEPSSLDQVDVTVSKKDIDANVGSQSGDDSWVQVYEAGYAKLKGGYKAIEWKDPDDVYEEMTGRSATSSASLFVDTPDDLGELKDFLRTNGPTTFGTFNASAADQIEQGLLEAHHAYAVIGIDDTPADGKTGPVVELSDPRGVSFKIDADDFIKQLDEGGRLYGGGQRLVTLA